MSRGSRHLRRLLRVQSKPTSVEQAKSMADKLIDQSAMMPHHLSHNLHKVLHALEDLEMAAAGQVPEPRDEASAMLELFPSGLVGAEGLGRELLTLAEEGEQDGSLETTLTARLTSLVHSGDGEPPAESKKAKTRKRKQKQEDQAAGQGLSDATPSAAEEPVPDRGGKKSKQQK